MGPIVHSPRGRWRPIHAIYDSGLGGFSMVIGFWDDEPVITARWNGETEEAKGMPLSSGYPVPFVLASFTWEALLNLPEIKAEDRELARSFLGRKKQAA
jgi:hypothetical protein